MFDCQTCGACCAKPWDVVLSEADEKSPVLAPLSKLDSMGIWKIMRRRKGACIALKGQVGCSVSCRVYKDRPKDCREFQVGSPECLKARAEFLPEGS